MADRDSQSGEIELVTDPKEKARIEADNAFRQTRAGMELLPAWINAGEPALKPSLFLRLHGILLNRISAYPGVFRPGPMTISHSDHKPPPGPDVPLLVEELCDYVNRNWTKRSAIHLAAYVLWRTNWIHPFADGNGRTARIVSYLVLCAHTRTELPGSLTIPKQIAVSKKAYYSALESADRHFRVGSVDVGELEDLLGAYLAAQLLDFFKSAGGRSSSSDPALRARIEQAVLMAQTAQVELRDAKPLLPLPEKKTSLLDVLERRPVLYSGLLAIALAILGLILSR